MNDIVFRSVIVAMFTIILAMAGYIMTSLGRSTENGFMAVNTHLDATDHRLDRTLDRLNDIDRRLAQAEARISDLQMRR